MDIKRSEANEIVESMIESLKDRVDSDEQIIKIAKEEMEVLWNFKKKKYGPWMTTIDDAVDEVDSDREYEYRVMGNRI